MAEEEQKPEEQEENVYSEEGREESVESGEISAEEEAFMKGYDEAEDKESKDEEVEDMGETEEYEE